MNNMKVILRSNQYTASILHQGAELEAFTKYDTNYIWTIDEQFWNKTSPVLFPIVGRLKNDSYQINGKTFHLSRHGFAREKKFKVKEQTENYVLFSLQENKETFALFPFAFELQIGYFLNDNELKTEYIIKNNSSEKMPFNIGAHPAFSLPNNFEDYSLCFNNDDEVISHLLKNDLFNNETLKIKTENGKFSLVYSLFNRDALVFKSLNSNIINVLYQDKPYLKINFDGFPFLGIWTKQGAPFLCIEPWQGHADLETSSGNIFEKEGIQILEPLEQFKCNFTIAIL